MTITETTATPSPSIATLTGLLMRAERRECDLSATHGQPCCGEAAAADLRDALALLCALRERLTVVADIEESAAALTCRETDQLAQAAILVGLHDSAVALIGWHQGSDDAGDSHPDEDAVRGEDDAPAAVDAEDYVQELAADLGRALRS